MKKNYQIIFCYIFKCLYQFTNYFNANVTIVQKSKVVNIQQYTAAATTAIKAFWQLIMAQANTIHLVSQNEFISKTWIVQSGFKRWHGPNKTKVFWRCNLKWRAKKRREKTSTNNVRSYCQKHHSAFQSENLTWKVHDKARSSERQQNQHVAAINMRATHSGKARLFGAYCFVYSNRIPVAWTGSSFNLRGKIYYFNNN